MFKKNPCPERRKYKRLDTIFPVEFQVLDKELKPASNWFHCFSQDIARGGLCLIVNNLSKEEISKIEPKNTNLLLQIHSPFGERCFLAYAKLAWAAKTKDIPFNQFLIGVSFTKIDTKEINRLLGIASSKKFLWRVLQLLILGLLAYLAVVIVNNFKLNSQTLKLIHKHSWLINKNLELKQNYNKLLDEKDKLNKYLSESKLEMQILEESIKKVENLKGKEVSLLENELSQARQKMVQTEEEAQNIKELMAKSEEVKKAKDKEIEKLQKELLSLQEKEKEMSAKLSETIARESEVKAASSIVEEERMVLSEDFKNQLYGWLRNHQNQRTGLVVSFEGDYNLKDTSFLYDQALVITAHTLFGEDNKAKKNLEFFLYKAKRSEGGGFFNAYYSNTGEVAEYIAHAGPNLWLGIAILQYTNKTKDYSYLNIAEQIAKWAQTLQDEEGGILGGKGINWYSTEHNLDGFAFFNMLYELTNQKQYKEISEKILKWLEKYAYNNHESVPVNRGKGDATIATDTFAWSVAALGPKRLKEINMDPEGIMEFALENCLVKTQFINHSGNTIVVNGFDFAKHQNMARGGVISCEWTAQMVLSFYIMSEHYKLIGELARSIHYQNMALKYLGELNKMAISSISALGQGQWCLPYASEENIDTGHGWRTPKGNRTGSVAATAYTIFAISKFNPLELTK